MSVLITGASGFVGQNLQEYFLEKGITSSALSLRNNNLIEIPTDSTTVIHLAGKAHDLKNASDENEYFKVNTELTKQIYKAFCNSNASTFIFLSSVKAVEDTPVATVDENTVPQPVTAYGKSKLAAEEYLLANQKVGTRLYILRPCMIHGPNNKGNLNLLYQIVDKGIPYPLGSFSNQRSFLSIENLCFVIKELLLNTVVESGIYTIADDETFSTNDLVELIGESLHKKAVILSPPQTAINFIAKIGDKFKLPLTSERLQKLTENYVVSNNKIKLAIDKELPVSGKEGLLTTFNSFKKR